MKARTATDAETAKVQGLIAKVVEPGIGKLIEQFNETLRSRRLRVGVEIKWFIDGVDEDAADTDPKKKR